MHKRRKWVSKGESSKNKTWKYDDGKLYSFESNFFPRAEEIMKNVLGLFIIIVMIIVIIVRR